MKEMDLTELQKAQFSETGLLELRSFVPKSIVMPAKRAIDTELERLQIKVGGKFSTSKLQTLPFFRQILNLSRSVDVGPEVQALFTADLQNVVRTLVPMPKVRFLAQPQLLLSVPHKEAWSLRGLKWHLDLEVPQNDERPGVQAFVLIDDVRPMGGATLAIAGSHRLHYLKKSGVGNAHTVLRRDPIFSQLYSESTVNEELLRKPQTIEGIPVSIFEMCGRAGDVFLMDLRVLHSPSINATKSVRMMATNRYIK